MTIPAKTLWELTGDKSKYTKRQFYAMVRAIKENKISSSGLFPVTDAWLNKCYRYPYKCEIKLEALNELLETYGVEYIEPKESTTNEYVDFLNVGDPCVATIVHCSAWTRAYRVAWNGYSQYVKQ